MSDTSSDSDSSEPTQNKHKSLSKNKNESPQKKKTRLKPTNSTSSSSDSDSDSDSSDSSDSNPPKAKTTPVVTSTTTTTTTAAVQTSNSPPNPTNASSSTTPDANRKKRHRKRKLSDFLNSDSSGGAVTRNTTSIANAAQSKSRKSDIKESSDDDDDDSGSNSSSDESEAGVPPSKKRRLSKVTNNTSATTTSTQANATTSTVTSTSTSTAVAPINASMSTTAPSTPIVSPKRKHKKKTKSKQKKNKSQSAQTSPPFSKKPVQGVDIQDLECCVCHELPLAHIYQCSNGHFLCQKCHRGIRESKNTVCPICRVRLSRRTPARNRLAERYLATIPMECHHNGCSAKIQFAYFKDHVEKECACRVVPCKYEPLGCDWKGLEKDHKIHRKACGTRGLSVKHILKKVIGRKQQNEARRKEEMKTLQKYVDITKMWEMRCRNVVGRDISVDSGQTLNMDNANSKITSRVFSAFHYPFEVQIRGEKVKNENKISDSVSLKIRMKLANEYHLRGRLLLAVSFLKGPDSGFTFEPLTFENEFSRKNTESPWFDFTVPQHIANSISSGQENIHIRAMIVDKRRGDVAPSFRAEHDPDGSDNASYLSDDGLSEDMDSGTNSSSYGDYSDDGGSLYESDGF